MRVACPDCGIQTDFSPRDYCCSCGAAWVPIGLNPYSPDYVEQDLCLLSRYARVFNIQDLDWSVSLGAGWTPLLSDPEMGSKVLYKLEYVSPTGSFKDRGTELEIAYLKTATVQHVVEDSSGNAGASMAAYAARAGIRADIYAPDSAPQAKLDQIAVYGAHLHTVPGPRIEATRAVERALADGAVYASHAYSPVYLLGQHTLAWEIWEQTGGSSFPDALIIPVGQGGLFLGAFLGFNHLLKSGIIERVPRLFAAQPDVFSPLQVVLANGLDGLPRFQPAGRSLADGVAITQPVRLKMILQAIRETGGAVTAVSEEAISTAYFDLARKGMFVEPTSALAYGALPAVKNSIPPASTIVVVLTGSGMKTPLLVK